MRMKGAAPGMKKKTTDEKVADLIRRLGSNHDGEIVATVASLKRTLQSNGRDLHSIAATIEGGSNGGLSEVEMQKIYDKIGRAHV